MRDHQGRWMRLFLSQARDGHAYRQRAVYGVKQCVRLQVVSCAEGVLGTTIAASTCSEQRQPHTQHRAQVVCLRTASHRQRRDGPR
jgi:hypothetical protein